MKFWTKENIMSQMMSMKGAERKVFQASINDGLWDIMLGSVFLMFAVAPFLSVRLGDFWSSAVFLPFWGLLYLGLRRIRRRVINPRIGSVSFGKARRVILTRFNYVMLAANLILLVLGFVAATYASRIPGLLMSIAFGLVLMAGFTFAAFYLGIGRLYVYGLMIGVAPVIGEWLWSHHLVSHHGFPVTFGTISGIMIFSGIILLLRLVRRYPAVDGDLPLNEG
jgi:hypothetical protein